MRLSVPQEWLLWMTKTTSQFRYRINPDVALTFQIRAPVQPAPVQPAPVQPAEPTRPRGRPRKVIADADPVQPAEPPRPRGRPRKVIADADPDPEYREEDEEHNDMVDVNNNAYMEDVDVEVYEAENAEGCELSVVLSVEQDEVDNNVNSINYYGEIPADANLQIGGGVDDMDAVHDDETNELTLVGDSEDDAVQHERPQVGMKTIPESYYDDAGLATDIEDVTLDSFDLEEEFADAEKSIDPEDFEDEFFEGEELLDAPAKYPVTPAGKSLDQTANEHHAATEIVFTGKSDSLDGLFTDDEENDLDASDLEYENHPHVDIQTDETAGSSLEQDDETTSARGNYARPFYPVLSPIPESPATIPKAGPSPLKAVIKAQTAPSSLQAVASATENAIRTAGKRKRLNHDSTQDKLFGQETLRDIISGRFSKRQGVDDEKAQEVSQQKEPRTTTSSSGSRSSSTNEPLPVGVYFSKATDNAPAEKAKAEHEGAQDYISEKKTTNSSSQAITKTAAPTIKTATGKRKASNDDSIDKVNYKQKTLASIISGHRTKRQRVPLGDESLQEKNSMQIEPSASTIGSGPQSSFPLELSQMADSPPETTKASAEKERSVDRGALDNVSETRTTSARSQVTKISASPIEPATIIKATGKRKRSDDERIADGNSEQKNNRSATISARPAKRRRSDESNLDTIHQDPIDQNSIHQSSIHQDTINQDTINLDTINLDTINLDTINLDAIDLDTIHQGKKSSTKIGDSDHKSASPIEPTTTNNSSKVVDNTHLEEDKPRNLDNFDDIYDNKTTRKKSKTTKTAPAKKAAPKKAPARSSSRSKSATPTVDIKSSSEVYHKAATTAPYRGRLRSSSRASNKASTKFSGEATATTTIKSSSKSDIITSNPANRRITRSMSRDLTPAPTESVLEAAIMDNHQSSSKVANMNDTAQSSTRSPTLSPPVKKALTLKEQRVLYAAKAKAAGKGDAEPPFRTVQVPITSTTSKPARRSTRPTSKAPKATPAKYAPMPAMKKNVRPSSKVAEKATAEPFSRGGSTISPPVVVKKALTLKEQRALYAARQKVVAQVTRQVPPKTALKENVRPSSKVAEKSPTEPFSKDGSPIASPIVKKALTLKEQMAVYAARGKVTANVLRQARASSSVAAESPTELAVRRYYSSSSTPTKASPSASPKTDTEASVGSRRTSASSSSRTASKASSASAGSSSKGSFRASETPISPQSAFRRATAKFEREYRDDLALQRSPREETTPAPKTSGQYTLKEQMKFAAAKRAASTKAAGNVSDKSAPNAVSSSAATKNGTSGRKRSREEDVSEKSKNDSSGRQADYSSHVSKRAKRN